MVQRAPSLSTVASLERGERPTRDTLRLLLRLASGATPDDAPSPGWAALLTLARAERCAGLVWLKSRAWIVRHAPAHVVSDWRAEVTRLDDASRRQLAACSAVVALLSREGISTVVLKGAPLSQRLYGDPFVRHSADLDLFVPADARQRAHEVLLREGWRHDGGSAPGEAFYRRAHDELNVLLEVHSSLTDDPLLSHVRFPAPDVEVVPVADVHLPAFGGPLLPSYLALHLVKHTAAPLLWLMDFRTLWSRLDEGERRLALEAAGRARVTGYLRWGVRRMEMLDRAAAGDERALRACGASSRLFGERHAALRAATLAPSPADAYHVLTDWVVRRTRAMGQAPWAARGRLAWLERIVSRARQLRTAPTAPSGSDARVVILSAPHSLALVREAMSRGAETWLVARGTSMWPTIPHGALVCVQRLPAASVQRGDVVLAESVPGEPVMHRVESVTGEYVILRGDNMPCDDRPIPLTRVIGRVTCFESGGVSRAVPRSRPGVAMRYVHRVRRRIASLATTGGAAS